MKSPNVGVGRLVDAAVAATGLDQFDSESYLEGLSIAAEGLRANALRTPEGAAFLEAMMVGLLSTRLRVADYARRHPEVCRGQITKPIVIMGMPRTGTTLISYLLSEDRKLRSLLRWEAASPVPPPTTETLKTDPRCLAMKAADAANPSPFAAIHFEPADGPTECLAITAQDFKALVLEAFLAYRPYADWLLQCDLTSAYEYHRLVLQILQSKAPGTWNLKLPSHAIGIRTLMRVYPDARVVWCHRDPFKVTGSLLSMMSKIQSFMMKDRDLDYIKTVYPNLLAEHVRRPMAVQDEARTDPFYHLHYNAMMRDPMGEVRRLYTWLGEELTPGTEAAMRRWIAENPQGKFGSHRYGLEEFGLSKSTLMPFFEDYMKRFGTEFEG